MVETSTMVRLRLNHGTDIEVSISAQLIGNYQQIMAHWSVAGFASVGTFVNDEARAILKVGHE
jgi:hypothetical protein